MKYLISILILLPVVKGLAQLPDSNSRTIRKPEIFTTGFMDVLNSGQVNASARFIRLYIGEPGRLAIPLSLYSGVSANNFQQVAIAGAKTNEHLLANFINPLSGLLNVSTDGILYFSKKASTTRAGWLYHGGMRVLTGFKTGPAADPQTGQPVNFLNDYVTGGLYFQTGAWERSNKTNMGIFWLSYRLIGCYTRPGRLRVFLPDIQTDGWYYGYCLGGGVDINNLINLKVLYYAYFKKPEISYQQPIYQFTFQYSLK